MVTRTEDLKRRDQERPLLEHIRELAYRLRRALIAIFVSFFVLFTFSPTIIYVNGFPIPIIYPDLFRSFSTLLIIWFIHSQLPPGMHLINVSPFDTIYVSAYISLFFGLVISLPFVLRELWAFIAPGLYDNEKRLIRNLVLPSFGLFLAGASFAYFIIIPLMLRFVMYYTEALGVEPTLALRAFIEIVINLMLATGLAFEFPVVMGALTYLGLVKAETWKKYWRWGIMVSFIIAYIISPGTGGGIMETIIGLTLSALYFSGYFASKIIEKRRIEKQKSVRISSNLHTSK